MTMPEMEGDVGVSGADRSQDDIEFEFDVIVVDGERGRRLAAAQVDSILEVLEWFSRKAPPPAETM
jgi:hypothetical protein